jgi:hypothetical protein
MVTLPRHPCQLGSRSVKKGRHRRFEEARKLKQSGPDFLFNEPTRSDRSDSDADDEDDDDYAALARKYGALDDEPTDDDS